MQILGIYGFLGSDLETRSLMGVMRYVEKTGGLTIRDFRFAHGNRSERETEPSWQGKCDGVIVTIGKAVDMTESEVGDWVLGGGVPAVSTTADWIDPRIPYVAINNDSLAKSAAEHLIDCDCRSFLYFGFAGSDASKKRGEAFVKTLAQRGTTAQQHLLQVRLSGGVEDLEIMLRDKQLVEHLLTLPKPLGIWAMNDNWAHALSMLCEELELEIPAQVKLVGTGDFGIARSVSPTLTSLRTPHEQIGYTAAQLLHRLLKGKRMTRRGVELEGAELIVRESTLPEIRANGSLRKALKFIELHACEGITLDQVAAAGSMPRRSFVRHFRNAMGHSVGEEIARVRLQRAKMLLAQSQLSISYISAAVGFEDTAAFSKFFTKQTGFSPSKYGQAQVDQNKNGKP